MTMIEYGAKFEAGLGYHDFLHKHGTDEQRRRWQGTHEHIMLSDSQRTLLASFVREIKVLCLAGTWCGDCVNQCPIFDHFEIANPRIRVRYFDRDAHPDLGQALSVCGAARVPAVSVSVGRQSAGGFLWRSHADKVPGNGRGSTRSVVPDRAGRGTCRAAGSGRAGLA